MFQSEPAEALLGTFARNGLVAGTSAANRQRSFPVDLTIVTDLAAAATDWRAFEGHADCTVFQTFAWQSAYMASIAPHEPLAPAIVIGRSPDDGAILFFLPLAVTGRRIRRLTWLAGELSDYNAPLLAPDFAERVKPARFLALWRDIVEKLAANPKLRPDAVVFEKMPERVGGQPNPFLDLPVSVNPSGAYLTNLAGSWDVFYRDRRSSATRRRDRTKRKRLGEIGEVRFATSETPAEIDRTLSTLFAQKGRAFGRMGIPDIFAPPGRTDFFRILAGDPANRGLVHVSRLDVGDTMAATNFGLVHGGRYHHILAGYDDGVVSKFGPGAAHLHDLMGYAIERGCNAFDFTIGDEPYKRDWADAATTLYDYRTALTWRGLAVTLPMAVLSRLKRIVKQTPLLWRMATALRTALGWLRRRDGIDPQTE